jgi:L-rhamnose isomerase/sugar isomerase
MLDQCHNIEEKIPAEIRSVLNVQEMMARALLVDREALRDAQRAGDVLGAHAIVMDAFSTDIRPILADWRVGRRLPADPVSAYRETGYAQAIAAERVGGSALSWGA